MPTRALPPARRARVLRTAAAVVMLLGYADLARGGLTLAPLMLVASYTLLVPLALLLD